VGLVSRRYLPAGELLAAALAGRIDSLERQLTQTARDVTALGRGLTDLTTQIRTLTTNTTANLTSPAGSPPPAVVLEEGQPDWFAVTDPDTARDLLTGLSGLVGAVLVHHGITLTVACWALHPDVVADLLALAAERDAAYTGPRPTPVSEWLSRWLPATTERITTALTGCVAERGHRDGGRVYDTTGFDPLSAAAWWAMDRHVPAAEAFALTRLT
jgi:hypothetical protein